MRSHWLAVALSVILGGCAPPALLPLSWDKGMHGLALEVRLDEIEEIPRDQAPEAYAQLERIVQRLRDTGLLKHEDDFDWEVTLFHDDDDEAHAYPGGGVLLSTGEILEASSEDVLAAVLAHELVHSDRRHAARSMTLTVATFGLALRATSGWFGPLPSLLQLAARLWVVGRVVDLVERHAYSKSSELEADLLGVELACAAGYRGASLVDGVTDPEPEYSWFNSTHPTDARRKRRIEQRAQELGCPDALSADEDFAALRAALPAPPQAP